MKKALSLILVAGLVLVGVPVGAQGFGPNTVWGVAPAGAASAANAVLLDATGKTLATVPVVDGKFAFRDVAAGQYTVLLQTATGQELARSLPVTIASGAEVEALFSRDTGRGRGRPPPRPAASAPPRGSSSARRRSASPPPSSSPRTTTTTTWRAPAAEPWPCRNRARRPRRRAHVFPEGVSFPHEPRAPRLRAGPLDPARRRRPGAGRPPRRPRPPPPPRSRGRPTTRSAPPTSSASPSTGTPTSPRPSSCSPTAPSPSPSSAG